MSIVSTSTEFILTNSLLRSGAIRLPSTFQATGRILTIKDQLGSWGQSTVALAVNNPNQTFEDGSFSTIMRTPGGWATMIAGNNNKWYTIGGTQFNAITTSTIQSSQLLANNISTGITTISTLTLVDQRSASTNTLYTMSTMLYYNISTQSTILAGTRQASGFNLLPMRRLFQPNQISGLQLWFDATDNNTFTISGNIVRNWGDKSGNVNNATGTGSIAYSQNAINRQPAMNFNNNWFTGNFRTANTGTSVQIFAVVNYINGFFASRILSLAQPGFNDYNDDRFLFLYRTDATTLRIRRNAVGLSFTTPGNNVPFLVQASFIGTTASGGVNGDLNPSSTNTGLATALNITSYAVAQNTNTGDPSGYMVGFIGEILYYNTSLTTLQRQQVEGYLAWKWGLVGNLPTAHPYKSTLP